MPISCYPCCTLVQPHPTRYHFFKGTGFSSCQANSVEMFGLQPELEGRMPTKIELTLEQSQQGVSNDVLGEVNPVHAYYNGSCTSKDNEDPSWSTSFKTRRTQKTSSALEDFISVVFIPDRNISPTHYPCDSARTFRVILFSIHNDEWKSFQCHHQTALRRPYALSWKPYQGDSLNLPVHRIHKDGDGDASFQLKLDSLPHAYAQTTKTFYKHQDLRIMKAQELKTKTSA
ncbi:hypothetical protein Tco_1525355 [Tanacetum coccineum]